MPFRLIGICAFPLEQIFLSRDFPIFFVIILFFFIFSLSHRPSALRKRGKGLIFTPNISTGDGGVHRHQAIVPFLLYDTTTNHGAFNFTSLNDAILQPQSLSAYALYMKVYSADLACCSQCCRFRPCNFWLPQLQLNLCLVSYGVYIVRLRMSHNELHSRTNFSHPFCLELLFVFPLFYELDLINW